MNESNSQEYKTNSVSSKIIWGGLLAVVIVLLLIVLTGLVKNQTMEELNPIVTMEVENYGTIKLELYPEMAPETVKNFITLANNGFYDGLTFTRVVKDFMIQGGDVNNDGTGNAMISELRELEEGEEDFEYGIPGEFFANGVDNMLTFQKGVIGMARNDFTSYSSTLTSESYNSGSSQFFIMTKDTISLNGVYTAFGRVIEGLEIVEEIENTEVVVSDMYIDEETGEALEDAEISKPAEDIVITKVTVETYGIEYELPLVNTQFDYMSWIYSQYGINPDTMMIE